MGDTGKGGEPLFPVLWLDLSHSGGELTDG